MSGPATFYTVSDERFFTGTVALINSLRLTGNGGEIVVLDQGLTTEQRARLERHARVADLPPRAAVNPLLLKPFPHVLDARGTIVIIDSDMIVTTSLDAIIDRADQGRICMFSDHQAQRDRWFAEWESGLGLSAAPRHQPYLNSGFVAFSVDAWPALLPRWWQACERIPSESTRARGAAYDQPYWDGDQDALNAVLMAEIPAEALAEEPQASAPSSGALLQTRIVDRRSLACANGGTSTVLLHYTGSPKPWESSSWMRVRRNAYVGLLGRVLLSRDAPLRLAPSEVPVWLRPGPVGASLLTCLSLVNGAARAVVRRTSGGLRERLGGLRRTLAKGRVHLL